MLQEKMTGAGELSTFDGTGNIQVVSCVFHLWYLSPTKTESALPSHVTLLI